MSISTQIDILRHGECEGGAIFRGSTNVALLPEGSKNMQRACDIANTKSNNKGSNTWDVIITSPLIRCHGFAASLAQNLSCNIAVEPRLKEIHFGDWENRKIDEVWKTDEKKMSAWTQNPLNNTPPNGEHLQNVADRVAAAFGEIKQQYKGKNILLVTHGGIIRVLLAYVLEMPLHKAHVFHVPYACMSRVSIYPSFEGKGDNEITKLVAYNFTCEAAI